MFIAARPVKLHSDIIEDKVLVFDTEDLTLEYASSSELRSLITDKAMLKHIGGSEIVGLSSDVGIYTYIDDALELAFVTCAKVSLEEDGAIVYIKDKIKRSGSHVWDIDGYTLDTNSLFVESEDNAEFINLTVNADVIYQFYEANYKLHYAFKFRDYLVMRFTDRMGSPVVSVILDENSKIVCVYLSIVFLYGDKSLYTQVEMMCTY